jgi:hypothetical protein
MPALLTMSILVKFVRVESGVFYRLEGLVNFTDTFSGITNFVELSIYFIVVAAMVL